MKLIPFNPQYLRPDLPLPFGLRDATGRLLLAAGAKVSGIEQLKGLVAQPLFAVDAECADWQRRLNAAMDAKLREGAALKDVAAARPDQAQRDKPTAGLSLFEQWEWLVGRLDTALRELRPDTDALARLHAVHKAARELHERRPDATLYHLVFQAGHSATKYASHHAMLAMLVSEQAATMLCWPAEQVQALGLAALTMNVAMHRLQDQLAISDLKPTAAMRAEIDAHAVQGARLLAEAGLADELVLAVVRLHHDQGDPAAALAQLAPPQALARLLRRVDIFTAKISRRATRAPMSPVQAAREAVLDAATGQPDEIGGALLKAVGLYPPGSFVELVSGELGIVVARGRRANLPYVAALVSAAGNPLGEPALRDALDRRHAIKAAVASDKVRVRPPHDKLMALR